MTHFSLGSSVRFYVPSFPLDAWQYTTITGTADEAAQGKARAGMPRPGNRGDVPFSAKASMPCDKRGNISVGNAQSTECLGQIGN